ncbi:hypothetical protein [Rheinheimera sp.]|uniref:hypothetical protein n=1 Tax=Rheinheimera sp. TaxID=1869214 RepID=UPI003D286C51
MKRLLSSALFLLCSNAYAALQCPSDSMIIYSDDWHKYLTSGQYTVRQTDITDSEVCISPRKNPNNQAANSNNPLVDGNVMKFNYPVVFDGLMNVSIFGEEYDGGSLKSDSYEPDFLRIPYFKAGDGYSSKSAVLTINSSKYSSIYYIRAENTGSPIETGRTALRIAGSEFITLKHLEIVSPNISLNVDSSFDTTIKRTGFRCDYFCIQNHGSPKTKVVQSHIHQIFTNNLNDTHPTISINPNQPVTKDGTTHPAAQSTIEFEKSVFLIKTGTAFAANSLLGINNRGSNLLLPAKVTVKDSTFQIHKFKDKDYGFGYHHANYGLVDIDIQSDNKFTHGKDNGTPLNPNVVDIKDITTSDIQLAENLISWKGKGGIQLFYNDSDYAPSHHILQKIANDSHDRYIRVCVSSVCKYSTNHSVYQAQRETINLDTVKTYSSTEISLCSKALNQYGSHAARIHIEFVCRQTKFQTRKDADIYQ